MAKNGEVGVQVAEGEKPEEWQAEGVDEEEYQPEDEAGKQKAQRRRRTNEASPAAADGKPATARKSVRKDGKGKKSAVDDDLDDMAIGGLLRLGRPAENLQNSEGEGDSPGGRDGDGDERRSSGSRKSRAEREIEQRLQELHGLLFAMGLRLIPLETLRGVPLAKALVTAKFAPLALDEEARERMASHLRDAADALLTAQPMIPITQGASSANGPAIEPRRLALDAHAEALANICGVSVRVAGLHGSMVRIQEFGCYPVGSCPVVHLVQSPHDGTLFHMAEHLLPPPGAPLIPTPGAQDIMAMEKMMPLPSMPAPQPVPLPGGAGNAAKEEPGNQPTPMDEDGGGSSSSNKSSAPAPAPASSSSEAQASSSGSASASGSGSGGAASGGAGGTPPGGDDDKPDDGGNGKHRVPKRKERDEEEEGQEGEDEAKEGQEEDEEEEEQDEEGRAAQGSAGEGMGQGGAGAEEGMMGPGALPMSMNLPLPPPPPHLLQGGLQQHMEWMRQQQSWARIDWYRRRLQHQILRQQHQQAGGSLETEPVLPPLPDQPPQQVDAQQQAMLHMQQALSMHAAHAHFPPVPTTAMVGPPAATATTTTSTEETYDDPGEHGAAALMIQDPSGNTGSPRQQTPQPAAEHVWPPTFEMHGHQVPLQPPPKRVRRDLCKFQGCTKQARSLGMCTAHRVQEGVKDSRTCVMENCLRWGQSGANSREMMVCNAHCPEAKAVPAYHLIKMGPWRNMTEYKHDRALWREVRGTDLADVLWSIFRERGFHGGETTQMKFQEIKTEVNRLREARQLAHDQMAAVYGHMMVGV